MTALDVVAVTLLCASVIIVVGTAYLVVGRP